MKHSFKDPTAEDGDYCGLTREERKYVYITAGIFLLMLIIEGLLIYSIIW